MRLLLESAIKSRCEGAWAGLAGKRVRRWGTCLFQREVRGCIVEGALASASAISSSMTRSRTS